MGALSDKDADTYTVWRCRKCGAYMKTAVPCLEVGHRCPSNNFQPTTMTGESQ